MAIIPLEMPGVPPKYLEPYLKAARRYGAGFGTLLWASPGTQAARFDALLGAVDVSGKTVLDVGCGRADLLQHIIRSSDAVPQLYIGLEAVDELAAAAERKTPAPCRIIRGDFVANPALMDVNPDIILVSGAFNTMDSTTFYQCIQNAWQYTRLALAFNFLDSPRLAAASHLTWHRTHDVVSFARTLGARCTLHTDYMPGDATLAMRKDQS